MSHRFFLPSRIPDPAFISAISYTFFSSEEDGESEEDVSDEERSVRDNREDKVSSSASFVSSVSPASFASPDVVSSAFVILRSARGLDGSFREEWYDVAVAMKEITDGKGNP